MQLQLQKNNDKKITLKNMESKSMNADSKKSKDKDKVKYNGEVFTPATLVEEMLNALPQHLFSNPGGKWLEPSAGEGVFVFSLISRLTTNLRPLFATEADCKRHIIENMIYMVELDESNSEKCKLIATNTSVKVNIWTQDFLTYESPNIHFDVIFGNPPFNNGSSQGKNKLYEQFMTKCYEMNPSYMCFIVPDNLFSSNKSKFYSSLVTENKIHISYINFTINQFFKGIQQPMCYFIGKSLINTDTNNENENENDRNTLIQSATELWTTKLVNRPLNPVRHWTEYYDNLLNKYLTNEENKNVVYNRGYSLDTYKQLTDGDTKYKLLYKKDTIFDVCVDTDTDTSKSKNKSKSKSKNKNIDKLLVGYRVKKLVLFMISTSNDFFVDTSGTYCVGPNTIYISLDAMSNHEIQLLVDFFASSDYKDLVTAVKTTRQFLKMALIQHLNINYIVGKM